MPDRRAHGIYLGRSGRTGPASWRSHRGCRNWAGRSAATCGWTPAGVAAISTAFVDTRLSFSRPEQEDGTLVSAEEVRARWAYSELLSDRPYDDPSVQELKKKALERVPFEDLTAEEHSVLVDRI